MQKVAKVSVESSGLRYNDKVTVVTGGSKGIGEGCVRVFVRQGSKVVFCARGEEAGLALESEMNSKGPGEAYFVKCDVTNEDDIKNLINKTVEKYGQIDCLINNAGTHPPVQFIDDISAQEFKDLFNLNVVSYFLASKYALPHLRKTKGNIINDSSLVGQLGQLGAVSYVTTKGAISAMSRALAVDEAKYGVRVNTFSPGGIWTPLLQQALSAAADWDTAAQSCRDTSLLGRMGTIEEAGQLCLYLAAEATFLTGVDIPLSGGAELGHGKKTRIEANKEEYF